MDVKIDRHAVMLPLLQVVRDVKDWRQDCGHDYFRLLDVWVRNLTRRVITRGAEQILFCDLPRVGKLYDAGLSTGYFDIASIPKSLCGRASSRDGCYLLTMECLLGDSFSEEGKCLNPDPNVVLFTRQLLYMYKKVQVPCNDKNIRKAAYEYKSIEDGLQAPSGAWQEDQWLSERFYFRDCDHLVDAHPRGPRIWDTVDRVFGRIVPNAFLDPHTIIPRHGPGSVADQKTGCDKFTFQHWPDKLASVFPIEDFSSPNWMTFCSDDNGIEVKSEEPPARLLAVPKTFDKPRLIASEPISHQFIQQGLMKWLRDNLTPPLRRSVDFTRQDLSQEAARAASVDGRNATVDLSAASDRLSCFVVERAFGSNQTLLRALHACRSRTIIDSSTDQPCWEGAIPLKKFAAQGSAVTFPIQTIVYTGLCYAAVLFSENLEVNRKNILRIAKNVRVYGDDICLPRTAVPYLTLMFNSLGLKVNGSKTHYSGSFRESCGLDAYKGTDVTPCYIASWMLGPKPENLTSWIDVMNNAHKAGFWRLSEWMWQQVPDKVKRRCAITQTAGDGFRAFTFSHGFMTDARTRWNRNIHIEEAHLLVMRSRVRKKSRRSWQSLYQYLLEDPSPDCHWTSGYLTKKSVVIKTDWVPVH